MHGFRPLVVGGMSPLGNPRVVVTRAPWMRCGHAILIDGRTVYDPNIPYPMDLGVYPHNRDCVIGVIGGVSAARIPTSGI